MLKYKSEIVRIWEARDRAARRYNTMHAATGRPYIAALTTNEKLQGDKPTLAQGLHFIERKQGSRR